MTHLLEISPHFVAVHCHCSFTRTQRPLDNVIASGGGGEALTTLGNALSMIFPITLPGDANGGVGNFMLLDLGELSLFYST